jgi:hypothetical protein
MTMHDLDDVDALWRDALEQLAPVPGEPAPERVRRRVTVRRRRRWVSGAAMVCIPLLIASAALMNRHETIRHLDVSVEPTTSPRPHIAPPHIDESFNKPVPGAPLITAVLDDTGLHFTPAQVPSGTYNISFSDRRSGHRDSNATLEIYVAGPGIAAASVNAGTTGSGFLCFGAVAVDVAENGQLIDLPGGSAQFDITPSKECTTPVT